MLIRRRKSRPIMVGRLMVGGDAPISVQSMTNTLTEDVASTVAQIRRLVEVGAELVRVAVNTPAAAEAIGAIRTAVPEVPLIADIHFDYKLALRAMAQGVDCVRINPGNLRRLCHVREVIAAAKEKNIPIRIGVNAGSLDPEFCQAPPSAEILVASALRHINLLVQHDYDHFKVSVKASDPRLAVEAYRKLAPLIEQPLHLGLTEAGSCFAGSIKSSVALGILLSEGLGDTLRISLAADPIEEIKAGYALLGALNLRRRGVNIIACPTCARQNFDVIGTVCRLERHFEGVAAPLDVSVIGCCVNGHGEAAYTDIGVVGLKGGCIYYEGGIRKPLDTAELTATLIEKIEAKLKEKAGD